jgi:hypothetical protein
MANGVLIGRLREASTSFPRSRIESEAVWKIKTQHTKCGSR